FHHLFSDPLPPQRFRFQLSPARLTLSVTAAVSYDPIPIVLIYILPLS
ncbi:hypothetical protein A2U01_0070892, partial [Trifolium medium]|nr:hypothetical protein [Trifolium medium]